MTRRRNHAALYATAALAGALLSLPQGGWASAPQSAPSTQPADHGEAAQAATAALNKKQFRDVHATVENGVATLTGTVAVYADKVDADKRVLKAPGVRGLRDEIEIAGPNVPDNVLQAKLQKKVEYDRVGYDAMFDAITVKVNDGVVTLGGHAMNTMASTSALALVENSPGVKGVANQIAVDPPSATDNEIRLRTAAAIYNFPSLNQYAIDPAKPIRISVQQGHVELNGTVNSESDKEVAYVRARAVPGVFSVQNNLKVAGQTGEQTGD